MLEKLMDLGKNFVMAIGVIAIMVIMANKVMDKAISHAVSDIYEQEDCVYAEAVKNELGSYTIKADYVSEYGNRYHYEEDLCFLAVNGVQIIIDYLIE